MVANTALPSTTWCSIWWAAHRTGSSTQPGLPCAVGSMICFGKSVVNMNGWNCSPASSSQINPSDQVNVRRHREIGVTRSGTGVAPANRAFRTERWPAISGPGMGVGHRWAARVPKATMLSR